MKLKKINDATFDDRSRLWTLALVAASVMTVAVQCSAATLYVSQTSANPSSPYSTPDTAAHTIQPAVDAASDGDTVLVEPGQYDISNQVSITKAITLQSVTGASNTILNVELFLDRGLSVSNSAAVVDGFAVQPDYTYPWEPKGIYLVGGTIQNCIFTNFLVGWPGSAVYMIGGILSNSVVADYHRFGGESASAVYCSDGGLVTDCQVLGGHNAQPFGIGIYLVNSQLRNSLISGAPAGNVSGAALAAYGSTVVNCTITNNYNAGLAGGAYLDSCLMDRCIVADNRSASGGGIFETNSIIRDSLIVNNSAGDTHVEPPPGLGGGVYMQGGELVNCTVSGNGVAYGGFGTNLVAGQGAGVYVESGGITNCIIFGNGPTNWFNVGLGIFDHSCTAPDPGGVGNITQDPQFADPTDGDFHLATNSPCIAAGIVQSWMTGTADLDGNPRTTNGVVDMGAYQNPSATAPQPVMANFVANPDSGAAPLTVQFTDLSSGPVSAWDWTFGDGMTSPAQNPTHTYTNAGNYTVTLTVSGSRGQTDSDTQVITVTNVPPQQQIESLLGMVNNLVQQGTLNRGGGNQLTAKLNVALKDVNDGNSAAACNQVGTFINQVQTLTQRGALTQNDGQSLLDAANQIRTALGCQ